MDIHGYLRFFCDRCGESETVYCNLYVDTVSSIKAEAAKNARSCGWKVTRQKRAYCPTCWAQIKKENKNF